MRQIATAGVQHEAIHLWGDQPGFLQRLFSPRVNELQDMAPGRPPPELLVSAVRQAIRELHGIDAAAPLLRDDRRNLLANCHEEGRDAWWNARCDVGDACFGKGTRTTRQR